MAIELNREYRYEGIFRDFTANMKVDDGRARDRLSDAIQSPAARALSGALNDDVPRAARSIQVPRNEAFDGARRPLAARAIQPNGPASISMRS